MFILRNVFLSMVLSCIVCKDYQTCQDGLDLHGKGQWRKALDVFAEIAVKNLTPHNDDFENDILDCIFGAALSLNALGFNEQSLSAFRLSQRLQVLDPRGSMILAAEKQSNCREFAASRSSDPYPSCNGFRATADLLHDALGGSSCRFEPTLVFPGAVVFVNAFLLRDFALNKHPFIRHPYVLISHCSDAAAPGPFDYLLDDSKLVAWFAQNADLSNHPRLHPIPIGLANPDYPHGNVSAVNIARAALAASPASGDAWWGGVAAAVGSQRGAARRGEKRARKLYINFDADTSPERGRALEALGGQSWVAAERAGSRGFPEYLSELQRHRYVLCPTGNGLDTHRMWEALLMGALPVAVHTTLDRLYDALPVVLVDDWEEVTPERLDAAWDWVQAHPAAFHPSKMLLEFWAGAIRAAAAAAAAGRPFAGPSSLLGVVDGGAKVLQ